MIGIRGRARTACGHCWHVVETGWTCCGERCRGRVKASAPPPPPGTAACRTADGHAADDAITAWLPEPPPDRPAGGRVRRYPYRRLRAL